MTQEVAVKEKVNWIPLAVLSAILSFLTMASYDLLGGLAGMWQCGYNLGAVSRTVSFVVWPYLLLILVYPLRKRFNLSSSFLMSLYAVGNSVSYMLGFSYQSWPIWASRAQLLNSVLTNLWWQPPISAVNAMAYGSIPTNWAEWGPIVLVLSFLYITFYFFTSSVVLIFRHTWLDVEQIPFPLTLAGYEILKRAESSAKGERNMKLFWIGFILAFVFEVPIFMARTFPWFPDIYNWRAACPSGAVHSTVTDIIGQTLVGYTGYSMDAIAFSMILLIPLSISFNVWFWTIIVLIFDQIAYATGSFTSILSESGAARMCCSSNNLGFMGPFQWNILSMAGGFLALAMMQIFLHRNYLITTVKAAINKAKPDWETNEVMSYRSTYIMLVLSFIACLLSLNILGADFWASFLLIIFNCFTTWLAVLILFGLGAFGAADCRIWSQWIMRIRWPTPPSELTTGFLVSEWWSFMGSNVNSYGFGNGFFVTALNLKMSKLSGTSNKNAFWVGAMAMVISAPVLLATEVWLGNLYGAKVGGLGFTWAWPSYNCLTYAYSLPSNLDYALYGIAGFITVVILSILHATYIWFPLEPVGFIIATSFGGFFQNVWSIFLVGWIVKTIVLRIGGSKLYEKLIVPGVGGFAGGVALATLFGCLVGMFRFYVPY